MTNQLESLNPAAGHPKEFTELTSARSEVFAAFESQSINGAPKSAEPQSGFLTFDDPFQSMHELQIDRDQEHKIVDPTSRDDARLPARPEALGAAYQEAADSANSDKTCTLEVKPSLHGPRLDDVTAADQQIIDKIDYTAEVKNLCAEQNSAGTQKPTLPLDREHQIAERQNIDLYTQGRRGPSVYTPPVNPINTTDPKGEDEIRNARRRVHRQATRAF